MSVIRTKQRGQRGNGDAPRMFKKKGLNFLQEAANDGSRFAHLIGRGIIGILLVALAFIAC